MRYKAKVRWRLCFGDIQHYGILVFIILIIVGGVWLFGNWIWSLIK